MIKKIGMVVLGVITVALNGCVTTHYGQTNSLSDGKMTASCSQPERLTSEFVSVSCTFENETDDWIDLEATEASFTDEGFKINPLTPPQTLAFMKAYKFEETKNAMNFNMAVGSLALVGFATGALSGNTSLGSTAAAVGLGAVAAGAGKNIADEMHSAQYPQYGEAHLLGPVTSIPAKLFVRRTMIFQSTQRRLKSAQLEICIKQPKNECFRPVYDINSRDIRAAI